MVTSNDMLRSEFIAAGEKASRRLMIVLHGLGDSTAGYRWMPAALQLPGLNYLLVNAPDDYFGGYSWYDFAGEPAPGIERSRRMLFELLDARRQEGWPTEQTTLFGFSQGCLMTWEVGLRYPHRLAGLIGVSGYVHEPEKRVEDLPSIALQQRFLVTHGTLDPLIPFAAVREQVNVLKSAGLQVEWHEFVKAHTIAGDQELEVIRDFVRAGDVEK
jgi:phospholipase/carboxylesterase